MLPDLMVDEQLSKMDPGVRRIIVAWLLKNVHSCDDPRAHGKGLTADKSGIWRYRVGDYRILCDIRDEGLVVVSIEIEPNRKSAPHWTD